jgi:hypothetical protein
MPDEGAIPIRSYRVCFELERRIHKIDRWRIPVPYGVPLRGIGYAAAALACLLVAQRVPLLGELLAALHPALRLVLAPIGLAYALCQLKVDGRPAHVAAVAWLAYQAAPKRIAAFRAVAPLGTVELADIALAPDERSARYRRALITGPASVVLRYPARAQRRGRTVELAQSSRRAMWVGKRVELAPGQRLRLR